MNLGDLLARAGVGSPDQLVASVPITGLAQRADEVAPGDLFVCRRGATTDGHAHARTAVERGAAALLVERCLPLSVPQVAVPDTRVVLPALAAAFWGHPSRRMDLVGVTGTNGKTTTTFLVRAILEHHGWPTGVIGTLSSVLTTPEPVELQRRLAGFVADGCRAVAMEVSSHGLAQGRVDHTWFAVGVFTNLDRDHLDHHGDLRTYFEAKARLFSPERIAIGVVNRDDEWGRELLRRGGPRLVAYGLGDAAYRCGSSFTWSGHRIRLPLVGDFNVANALAAATACRELGVPTATIAEALGHAVAPPGRMEVIDEGQPFRVVVDCAHTPAALSQVVRALRPDGGRLIVVFGCGGDRDRGKRPEMGAVVVEHADVGILTADNPRTEPWAQICADVLAGGEGLKVEPDRRTAIRIALAEAAAGDVVLVAGKGDQTVQQFADHADPFDDRQVSRQLLTDLDRSGY